MSARLAAAAVVMLLGVAFAGCNPFGGSGDTPEPTPAPSPAATPTPTAAPAPPTPSPTPTAVAVTPAPTVTSAVGPSPTPTPTASPPPTPEPGGPVLPYNSYDTTGAVTTPGSYAFLTEGDDGATTAVTTYEALRDGTTTALLIHKSDAHGASQATLYDAVEAGDLFEWREADDCWVRYRVIGVEAGSDTRDFAIKSYSHTYTGCSGAIGGSGSAGAQSGRSTSGTATTAQFIWAPVTLKTGAFTAPTWHGPWLVVPKNWAGPVPATALFTGPSISWPPSPLPAPNLGTGWSGGLGRGYPDTELEGFYSYTDGGFLDVYIFQLGRWPIATYRLSTTYAAADRIHEFRVIDGRHAHLSYARLARIHRSKLDGAGCRAAGEFGGCAGVRPAVPGQAGARSGRSGALRARARGCARRARACWREPRTRGGAVSGRQAGSGIARSRASATASCPAQGQRLGRCRVQRRAEWVSRPGRAK